MEKRYNGKSEYPGIKLNDRLHGKTIKKHAQAKTNSKMSTLLAYRKK